jgi:hypothetical protein
MNSIKLFVLILLFAFGISHAKAQNVQITNTGNPKEPAIMMDPKNPNNLVAGSNLNFVYTSNDGGNTWTINTLTSSYGVWGDPVIDVDTAGNFYFTHLANTPTGNWIDRIVCHKSNDNGTTWNDGSYTGLNGTKAQDKQWTIVDRNNNNIYMTWTEFDEYGSANPSDSSRILFSKSLDQGETWSAPLKINIVSGDCIDKDNTVEGATPAIGPEGEIYVAWAGPNGLVFNRSLNQGETWLTNEIAINSMPGGWDFNIPGLDRANGLPITKCDLSGGPNHGTIYVNWCDQRNGTDNTDVWLSQSKDGGNTWSDAVRVNSDASDHHQFFTWMDIDQTNGHLYFVFYDRRNHTDNQTDVYMAISSDGGNTFANRIISDSPFVPQTGIFFGDYNNITAHNGIVRPIWTRFDTGVMSLWTDVSDLNSILSAEDTPSKALSNDISVFPNPSIDVSYVSFKLHQLSNIQLELIDRNGSVISRVIDNVKMDYGNHIIAIKTTELNLALGVYYCRLTINEKAETIKTIVVK